MFVSDFDSVSIEILLPLLPFFGHIKLKLYVFKRLATRLWYVFLSILVVVLLLAFATIHTNQNAWKISFEWKAREPSPEWQPATVSCVLYLLWFTHSFTHTNTTAAHEYPKCTVGELSVLYST